MAPTYSDNSVRPQGSDQIFYDPVSCRLKRKPHKPQYGNLRLEKIRPPRRRNRPHRGRARGVTFFLLTQNRAILDLDVEGRGEKRARIGAARHCEKFLRRP
jgi:hypothetical protein